MNMKNLFYSVSCAAVMVLALLTSTACTPGDKNTSPAADPVVVERCNQMSSDEDKCKGSKECTWNDTKDPKCQAADASIINKCAAIQLQGPCDTDTTCKWVGGVCQNIPTPGGKTISIYTLSKINDVLHGIESQHIKGLTASKDGQFVYLVGSGAMQLRAYDVNTSTLSNPGGDWNDTFKLAADHADAGDLQDGVVSHFAPSTEGIIIQLDDNMGVVAIKGNGNAGADTSLFVQGGAGNLTDGKHVVFFASGPFIYLFHQGTPAKSVLFKQYVSPPTNDNVGGGQAAGLKDGPWNNTLKQYNNLDINRIFTAAAEKANGDLFLGHKNGVELVFKADVGVDNKNISGSPIDADNLKLNAGVNNNHGMRTMAVVGDFLLLGLEAHTGQADEAQTGGLIIKNLVTNVVTKFGNGDGLTVNWIATRPTENRAFIGTDKGLLIFENGAIIELIPTKGQLIDEAYVKANQSNNTTGFAGDVWEDTANNIVGIDFDKNGLGYIAARGAGAADGGVFTFKITTKVLP